MPACPVCGGGAAGLFAGLLRCRACGLAFRPEKHFGAPVYAPGSESDIYVAAKAKLFRAALDRLERLLPAKGALLDVGCAGGELLRAAASRGWQAEGVEVDPLLAAAAGDAGFRIYKRPVEACGLPGGHYSAVSAFEVLSQMADPAAAAQELFRVLKPGGAVYVREFNASFHLTLRRLELAGLFKPLGASPAVIHNFNFTPRGLRRLLELAGFRNIEIRNSRPTSGDPYRTGGRLGGSVTGLLKVLYFLLAEALWRLSFGRLYAGSSLIAVAVK